MKPEFIAEWLSTPNDAFDGLKPLEVIERGEVDHLWDMIFWHGSSRGNTRRRRSGFPA